MEKMADKTFNLKLRKLLNGKVPQGRGNHHTKFEAALQYNPTFLITSLRAVGNGNDNLVSPK